MPNVVEGLIETLNRLTWERDYRRAGEGVIANARIPDPIRFGLLIAVNLDVAFKCESLSEPDAYVIGFYDNDLPRLRELGFKALTVPAGPRTSASTEATPK